MKELEQKAGFYPIKEFPKYFATKCGHIYSSKRKKFLVGGFDHGGYRTVCMFKDNKTYTKKVHRLIAETLIPNIENKPCVNHINGIKSDNSVDNLEWCTYSENNKHAFKLGLNKVSDKHKLRVSEMAKKNCKGANYQAKKVIDNSTGVIYNSVIEAAQAIGINNKTLSTYLNGRYPNKTTLKFYNK